MNILMGGWTVLGVAALFFAFGFFASIGGMCGLAFYAWCAGWNKTPKANPASVAYQTGPLGGSDDGE